MKKKLGASMASMASMTSMASPSSLSRKLRNTTKGTRKQTTKKLTYKGEGPTVRLLVKYYNLWYDNTKLHEEKDLNGVYTSMVNTLVKRGKKLKNIYSINPDKDLPIDPLKLRRLKEKFKSLAIERPFFVSHIFNIVYSMQQGEIPYFGGRYKGKVFPTYLVTYVIPEIKLRK